MTNIIYDIFLFWGSGALVVAIIMLCIGVKKYFFDVGITWNEIVQAIFLTILSWSFFIVCVFSMVVGVLEKMKIDNNIVIKGKKYVEYYE